MLLKKVIHRISSILRLSALLPPPSTNEKEERGNGIPNAIFNLFQDNIVHSDEDIAYIRGLEFDVDDDMDTIFKSRYINGLDESMST